MTTILVIDDEIALLEQIIAILSLEGYDTLRASDGVAGVKMAKEHLPDLIISDISMPKLDGYGVLIQIREHPATATIPFIFLSGMSEHSNIRRGMRYGANDYLTKPFEGEELIEAVESRLKQQDLYNRYFRGEIKELRSNITYSLPHEFRTPLNSVLGFAEMLAMYSDTMEREQIGSMANHILESGKRMHRLAENYLFFAQLEIMATDPSKISSLKNAQIEYEVQVLGEIAEERSKSYRRKSDLILDIKTAPVAMSFDSFMKISFELIDNAFKFSEPGTSVKITAHPDPKSKMYSLCIEDNGWGMSAKEIKTVGAYMQFNRALYEQQGLGLGLIIAKRLAELYEAEFIIESELKRGTTVCLKIPMPK